MADDRDNQEAPSESQAEQTADTKTKPAAPRTRQLPLWKVLLHNDDVNDSLHVVETIYMLTPLNKREAERRTLEAHNTGVSLLLNTHRERAELYVNQFASRSLTVTAEPV